MSDQFSHSTGRTTRKVSAPPGGYSTISFGNEQPPASPSAAPPALPAVAETAVEPEAAVDPPVTAAPAADVDTLDNIKLKALAKISSISKEAPGVKDALLELIEKLEAAGVSVPNPAALEADTALAKLQDALRLRGTNGIISLGKRFKSIDDDGDKKISFDEFKKALKESEVLLPEADIHRLFRFFDADCSGYLSFDEFMVGLRGQLNPRRQEMVNLAFKVLDKENSGQITLALVEKVYNASMHPDVLLGIKTDKEVLLEFMEVFEAQGGGQKGDGVIMPEEFNRYYGAISASIDNDDYFELVIRNAWHISGGEGWCQNTTCKRVLVLHTDGTQTVQEVKDDFYLNPKDADAMKKALVEQGVKDIQGVALYGLPTETPSAARPETPSSSPGPAMTPGNTNRKNNLRSSIVFG